jgi:hypothetical protein
MVLTCDGSEPEGGPWRVGLTGGAMRSEIDFGSGRHVDIAEETLTASLGWHGNPTFGVDVGVGAVLDGRLTSGGVDHDLSTGFLATVTGSWLALPERDARPFILASLTASVATADTDVGTVTALDLRGGLVVGKTFFTRLTTYAAVRVFGGPVSWTIAGADVTGGDEHHYSVGAGATLRLPGAFDVFFEGSPFGERSLNAGLGLSF